MKTCIWMATCPIASINWGWYALALALVVALGVIWYNLLFQSAWRKAVHYQCLCGANVQQGEKCRCESVSMLPIVMQILASALVGLMYFALTPLSIWLGVLVAVAMSGWMKASLKFGIPEWRRFFILAGINVGYFFIASLLFIGFALL